MPVPILIGAAAVGLGLAAYGTYQQTRAASSQADAQQAMIAEQQRQERIRMQAMQLESRRRSLEVLRQQQRIRAMSVAAAVTNGGNVFGSGLFGAFGQSSGQANTNLMGIQQQQIFGEQMFASNANLSQSSMSYASAQSDYMIGSSLSSLGGAIISNLGQIDRIGGTVASWGGFGSSAYNPARPGALCIMDEQLPQIRFPSGVIPDEGPSASLTKY